MYEGTVIEPVFVERIDGHFVLEQMVEQIISQKSDIAREAVSSAMGVVLEALLEAGTVSAYYVLVDAVREVLEC